MTPCRPTLILLESRDVPATFEVTNLSDGMTPAPGSLRAAIEQALLNPGGDLITFAPGLTGEINAVASFVIEDQSPLEIRGPGAGVIAINGFDGTMTTDALFINEAPATIISGLTIRNHQSAGFVVAGGGVFNSGGLTLDQVVITGNTADAGGGVANSGTLTITNSQITNNSTFSTGAGILSDGGTVRVSNTLISGNDTNFFFGGGQGGGAAIVFTNAEFTGVTFSNNTATDGGGLYVEDSTVTVVDSTFLGNVAEPGGESSGYGGGLALIFGGQVNVTDSTFSANFAGIGGGVAAALPSNDMALTLTNVTLDGNRSQFDGGSIGIDTFFFESSPIIRLTNVTSVRSAGFGRGIAMLGTTTADVVLRNTIAALSINDLDMSGGAIQPIAAPDIAGAFVSAGGNLIQDASQATFTPQATDLTGVDPQVGPLGNNGGPTQTVPLLLGSPALGLGVTGSPTPTTDQRGVARPAGGPIDTGAFQFRAPIGQPESYQTNFGTTLNVPAPGVLANDTAPDGGTMTATLVTSVPASAGTLNLRPDGSFTFTPAAGFSGEASFTYSPVVIGRAGDPVTVTISVIPLPPPPPPPPPNVQVFAVAAGAGGTPRVRTYDFAGNPKLDFLAFEPSFSGGVRVAVGDITGDGVDDIVVGAGPGGGPRVRVFDGRNGEVLQDFFAFESTFTGGVYVGAADVTGDGRADIVVGAGSLGAPRVRVYDGITGAVVRDFFAYDPNFRGGVRVGAGDLDGDGFADIVTAPGPSGGPHVRGFDGETGAMIVEFFAFDPNYRGGMYVTVFPAENGSFGSIGVGLDAFPDYTGSVFQALAPELMGTAGFGIGGDLKENQLIGPSLAAVYPFEPGSPEGVAVPMSVDAYPGFFGGVRVAGGPVGSTVNPMLITAPGIGGNGLVKMFDITDEGLVPVLEFQPFDSGFQGSVFVG